MLRPIAKLCVCIITICLVWGISPYFPAHEVHAHFRYYENAASSTFPQRLQDHLIHHPWEEGFLDVTQAPYHAAGDGITDDSEALQNAIDDAYASNLVVYFPEGTYLVSRQLRMEQIADWTYHPGSPFGSQRKFGHLLVGSTTGTARPVIKLADHSTVTDHIFLLFRWFDPADGSTAAERHYLATFRGIDVDMGANPEVSAISMAGAQHCVIQDVDIFGEEFHAGIYNLPGSGGSVVNLKVLGGKIGIYQNQYRPTPLVVGVHLEGQSQYGIDVRESRGALIVTGFNIISPASPSTSYRAVYVRSISTGASDVSHANLTMVDGQIEVLGGTGRGIYNFDQNVTLHNVFIKAHVLIESGVRHAPSEFVFGNSSQWKRIPEYFFATASDLGHIYIDSEEYANTAVDYARMSPLEDVDQPETDLIARHLWDTMPSWEEPDKLNIIAYGATPDHAMDDDAPAIQTAIDEAADSSHPNYGKTVFIPRGHFHIRSPIQVRPGVKLIGAGKNISVLQVSTDWIVTAPTAALATADDPQGGIVLSDFAILGNKPSFRLGTDGQKHLTLFSMKSGESLVRDIQFSFVEEQDEFNRHYRDNVFKAPLIHFSGNAGGRVYNLVADMSTTAELGSIEEPFRYVLVEGVSRPLTFYYFDIEHAYHSPQSEIRDSNQVSIFAFKYEFYDELMRIVHSRDINVFGGSGNYSITNPNDEAIFVIEDSSDVSLYNMARKAYSTNELPDALWVADGDDRLPDDHPIVVYRHAGNHLRNGSMELQEGWMPLGDAQVDYTGSHVFEGKQALQITGSGAAADVAAALQEQGPGRYSFEAWVQNDHSSGQVQASLFLDNGAEQQIIDLASVETGTTWRRLKGDAEVHWEGTLVSAELRIEHSHAQQFRIDYALLASRQQAVQLANLLVNNGFEAGLAGWETFGNVSLTVDTDIVYAGHAALKISDREQIYEGPQQSIKSALEQYGPGAYTFEARVKNEGPLQYSPQNGLIQTPSEISAKIRLTYGGETRVYTVARLAEDYRWKKLSGTVNLTWEGNLDEAIIYFTNTEPEWTYYMDHTSLTTPAALVAELDDAALQTLAAWVRNAMHNGDLLEASYTTESWARLQQALSEAEAVLQSTQATQLQVDEALVKLELAYDSLESQPASGGENGGNGSGSGGGGSADNGWLPQLPPAAADDVPTLEIRSAVDGVNVPLAQAVQSEEEGGQFVRVDMDGDRITGLLEQGKQMHLVIEVPHEGKVDWRGLKANHLLLLAETDSVLELVHPAAIYTMDKAIYPAMASFASAEEIPLSDLEVRLHMSRAPELLLSNARSKAADVGYELLVDPVELSLYIHHGELQHRLDMASAYVAKQIVLPREQDRLTTVVRVMDDGSVHHVPTRLQRADGPGLASGSDRRMSGVYAAVHNPVKFDDLSRHWSGAIAGQMSARLLLQGAGASLFLPDREVTRAEYAAIVVRGMGLMDNQTYAAEFQDISADHWAHREIAIAHAYDLIRGTGDGLFQGVRPITRQEGIVIIERALRLVRESQPGGGMLDTDSGAIHRFTDAAEVSAWAGDAIGRMIASGLVQGNGNHIQPHRTMTRAEAVVLLHRVLQHAGLTDGDHS
ncbi:glycosyl hydrolase family 28-related protein [Paenibacillus sp. 1P07SE]|uniref:glycosyl hydrolase family 28-related protein n=1 Tax=Paenibacillus sp. 1P07SE TaxID=3132209 RepID=UPI0039A52B6D